ncbi:MAG: hypothetical protein OEZ33_00960 [Gammaproteobacteria bacterium]|nr:hypothetical protein [Gammaproteobacteria bacterium]MDH5776751.1 hypothetical protein [Gammaproteobacteria bacterium]
MKKLFVLILCIAVLAACASKGGTRTGSVASIKVYGNWCGPDHPKDVSRDPKPIDRLDKACRRHDLCYVKRGMYDCKCDAVLNAQIESDLELDLYSKQQEAFAHSFRYYFKGSPCSGDTRYKTGPSRAIHNIYNKAERTVKGVYNKVFSSDDSSNSLSEEQKALLKENEK